MGGEEGTIVGKVTKCSLGSFQSIPRLFGERTLLPKAHRLSVSSIWMSNKLLNQGLCSGLPSIQVQNNNTGKNEEASLHLDRVQVVESCDLRHQTDLYSNADSISYFARWNP